MDKEKSQNSLFMHSLYAIVDVGKGKELLKLYVDKTNNPNSKSTLKRAYKLINMEKQQSGAKGSGVNLSLVTPTADTNTISDLFSPVKQYDARQTKSCKYSRERE